MSYFHLIQHETLGACEIVLLGAVWLGASAGTKLQMSAYTVAAALAGLAVIVAVWLTNPVWFIYAPAIGINLLLAAFLFSTLRRGSEPAITRIARIERDVFTPELYAYTRGVTLAWACFFAGLAVEATALIAFASVETILLFINLLNYVFIVLFFVAENIYRRIHLRHYTHMPFMALVSKLSRRGVMSLIRYRDRAE